MHTKNAVVWFNNSSGDLWGWIDSETEFGFLTIIDRKSFEEERSESRSSSATNSVEDEEALETSTLISKFSDSIKT